MVKWIFTAANGGSTTEQTDIPEGIAKSGGPTPEKRKRSRKKEQQRETASY